MTTKTIVNWGGHLHCVEVSDGTTEEAGVRVFRCDKNGTRNEDDSREVFVDPHEMVRDTEWGREDVLLVHVYRNSKFQDDPNEEGVPVTLKLEYNEICLTNDGNTTLRVAIFFQSFLESEGINKSDKLLVHGTILDKSGHKISKSVGNVIDPLEQLEKYGLYPVRYYSLNLSTYTDSPWNEEDLARIWNSEIVNDWGNLISRVLHLIDIKCNTVTNLKPEDKFVEIVNDYHSQISNLWNNYHIKDALRLTNELVKFGNKYINDNKTWSSLNFELELSNLKYLLITVNKLYFPVFGSTHCNEISDFIELGKKQIIFSKI